MHISIHAALAGRDFWPSVNPFNQFKFQSTRPLRAATGRPGSLPCAARDFNPRGPCGPRLRTAPNARMRSHFNPRGPCGPRLPQLPQPQDGGDFNPRGPCGPRRRCSAAARPGCDFNPRGPCGPRRYHGIRMPLRHLDFNPRGPCGPRLPQTMLSLSPPIFQSTRPLRAATLEHQASASAWVFQSTRPLRAATDPEPRLDGSQPDFNPRGPCGPRPGGRRREKRPPRDFNPRGPCGPRPPPRPARPRRRYFNPRGPCGPRPRWSSATAGASTFQSTRPLRAAT